jgi:glycosyltransferase involved in cell wall biosynthesis
VERDGGIVIVCDVSLELADATRTHALAVAGGFAALGLRVDLVARGADPHAAAVRYHRGAPGTCGRARRLVGVNAAAISLLLRRRRARRLYVRDDWASLPTVLAGRLLGRRIVLEVNDVPFGPGYAQRAPGLRGLVADRVKRLAGRAGWRAATGIVAVTSGIARVLETEFGVPPERIMVLPNGVDPDLFTPRERTAAAVATGLDPAHRHVVFVGGFQPWVDFAALLDGFALVAAGDPDARLVLVGDGPEAAAVDARTASLGIGRQVVRTGYVSDRHRVAALVGAATVCVVPLVGARRERIGVSPVKVPEYLAAGRAVVGTDLPGMREILEDSGAGETVPAGDAAALGAAVARLLADPAAADARGARGREAAEARYAWNALVARAATLFERDA